MSVAGFFSVMAQATHICAVAVLIRIVAEFDIVCQMHRIGSVRIHADKIKSIFHIISPFLSKIDEIAIPLPLFYYIKIGYIVK